MVGAGADVIEVSSDGSDDDFGSGSDVDWATIETEIEAADGQ